MLVDFVRLAVYRSFKYVGLRAFRDLQTKLLEYISSWHDDYRLSGVITGSVPVAWYI